MGQRYGVLAQVYEYLKPPDLAANNCSAIRSYMVEWVRPVVYKDMTPSSIPTFSRAGWALHKRSEAPYRSCTNTLTFDPTSDERENT